MCIRIYLRECVCVWVLLTVCIYFGLGGKKRAVKFTQSPTNERTKQHPNIHKYICMYDVHVYIVYIVKSVLFVCLRFCLSFCPQSAERVRKTRHTYLHFSHEYIHKYVQMYICIWTYRQAGGVAPTSFVFYFFLSAPLLAEKSTSGIFTHFQYVFTYVYVCSRVSALFMYIHSPALVYAWVCVCVCVSVCVFRCFYLFIVFLFCWCEATAA